MGLSCSLKLSTSTRADTTIGFGSCALPNRLPSINPLIALTAKYFFLALLGKSGERPWRCRWTRTDCRLPINRHALDGMTREVSIVRSA
jgi:hypothetical protein